MSATRIVKRRAFAASQPSSFSYWQAQRADARGELPSKPAKRITYHQHAIANGARHPTFQKNIRAARAENGLQPTSSDMCRVHGRRPA